MLTRIGLWLTAAYVLGFCAYAFFMHEHIFSLQPNEFGDFLAGLFAPLAFLWLVLGYFLQARELRNSVDALELQSKELANSVEQYREMVAVDRERLSFDRDAAARAEIDRNERLKPILRVRKGDAWRSGSERTFNYFLRNIGHECRDVEGILILDNFPGRLAIPKIDQLSKGEDVEWQIYLDNEYFNKGTLNVTYYDVEGRDHLVAFNVETEGDSERFTIHVADRPIVY